MMLTMICFMVDEKGKPALTFMAGVLGGAAVMIVPTRGVLALLAAVAVIALRKEPFRYLVSLATGAIAVPFILIGEIICDGGMRQMVSDTILFPLYHYASINQVPFGYGEGPYARPLLIWFPVLAVLTVIWLFVNRNKIRESRIFLTALAAALAGFLGSLSRPDIGHLAQAIPLASPLMAVCIGALMDNRMKLLLLPMGAGAVVLSAFPVAVAIFLFFQWLWFDTYIQSPRGLLLRSALPSGGEAIIARISAIPKAEKLFFYPYLHMLAVITDRRQVSRFDVFTPGYTTPEQYREVCQAVIRDANWTIIDRRWNQREYMLTTFPSLTEPDPPERVLFEQALVDNFELVARDGPFETRRRKDGINDAACAAIAP